MSKILSIGILVGMFFAGFLGGFILSEQTYSPKNLMANDPKTTTQWIETMMGTMMNDPTLHDDMIDTIMENPEMMQSMMNNQQFMQALNNP